MRTGNVGVSGGVGIEGRECARDDGPRRAMVIK
jgi:hypothetical protein